MAPLPADQADRDRARLHLHQNAVVEAGAGTGKTTLLTDRLLFQLLAGEKAAPVTRLVALTFTEKAAAEIKVRLADRLSDVSAGKADRVLEEVEKRFGVSAAKAAELARRALEDLDKAQIGTIHSFAAHVLRLYPVEAGVDPAFVVDEGAFFDELFTGEWARFLDEELGEKPPREAQWLEVLRLCRLEDLRELAQELCGEKLELSGLGGPDARAAADLEALASSLERLKALPSPGGRSKILDSIDDALSRLRALAQAARQARPDLPAQLVTAEVKKSSWPKAWADFAAEQALYEKGVAAANVTTAGHEALMRRALSLLLPFAKRFRRQYARRGYVSFDGLLLKARDLVRDRKSAREQLKRQYAAVFIDEFQDTDPLQGEFLLLLAEQLGRCADTWEEAVPGPGRLFVVGDPKQSIYRFRGADIAAYQKFTKRILDAGQSSACDLLANFRSPQGLIGPVNAVFEELMRELPGLQAPYKALQAGGDASPAVELVAVSAEDAAQAREREAAFIASWLSSHCGPGKPHKFKDAAILARTTRPFSELVDALRAAGVPYAIETERGFYGAPEVLDLVNLLRALDDPEDRVAVAGLLRSPLVLLEDDALYKLSQRGGLDYRRKSGITRVDAFFSQLASLRALVGRVPLGDLVFRVLQDTRLYELSAKAYHGAQTIANLSKFHRLAAQASDERGLTLKEFVEELLADLRDPKGEGESPLADEHLEAVRILTIHKSKGLEFPIVFLTNVSAPIASGRKAPCLLDWSSSRAGLRLGGSAATASMALLAPQEKEREAHQDLRLLYVGLTRAKKRLFVVGAARGNKGTLSELLSRAGAWPGPDFEGSELRVGPWTLPVRRVSDEALPARPASAEAPEALDAAALAKLWQRRLAARDAVQAKLWTTSPTAANKLRPLEEGDTSAREHGALVGRLCHKVLEWVDYKRPFEGKALEEALEKAERVLSRLSPSGDWPAARAEALGILAKFLKSDTAKHLATVEILGREIPFCREEDGVLVRGQIDLLYRDEGGRVVIGDYKSEAAPDAANFTAQGASYRRAIPDAEDFVLIPLRV